MRLVELRIDLLSLDPRCQARAAFSQDYAEGLAEHLRAGGTLPPTVVLHDGKRYWLADGFHRRVAYLLVGRKTIQADVRPGTVRDAVLVAAGANQKHGLHRSNADKRRAVALLLDDEEWTSWPNRQIAAHCGVSEGLVRTLRQVDVEEAPQADEDEEWPVPSVIVTVPSDGAAHETQSGRAGVLLQIRDGARQLRGLVLSLGPEGKGPLALLDRFRDAVEVLAA